MCIKINGHNKKYEKVGERDNMDKIVNRTKKK